MRATAALTAAAWLAAITSASRTYHPITIAEYAMSTLWPMSKNAETWLYGPSEVSVVAKTARNRRNGCGFRFRLLGAAYNVSRAFPDIWKVYCDGDDRDVYRMRVTEPGSTYKAVLRTGNGRPPERAELQTDGLAATSVHAVCVTVGQAVTVGAGGLGFCVDHQLLKACDMLVPDRWSDLDVDGWRSIKLTRHRAGVQRIAFTDVPGLIESFDRLYGHRYRNDTGFVEALRDLCDRVELVAGDLHADGPPGCPVKSRWRTRQFDLHNDTLTVVVHGYTQYRTPDRCYLASPVT